MASAAVYAARGGGEVATNPGKVTEIDVEDG